MTHPATISIQEAADLSGKSIQTIRRAIKLKKLLARKKDTPQGFIYSIDFNSLCQLYKIRIRDESIETQAKKTLRDKKSKDNPVAESEKMVVETADFKSFVRTMESLIEKHGEERRNFLKLVDTLQERIFVLENQLNLLKAPESKRWFHFWK